jgi:hypothetical protein
MGTSSQKAQFAHGVCSQPTTSVCYGQEEILFGPSSIYVVFSVLWLMQKTYIGIGRGARQDYMGDKMLEKFLYTNYTCATQYKFFQF